MHLTPAAPLTKEIKVRVPERLIVALHSQKILTGERIASIIERALVDHMRRMPAQVQVEVGDGATAQP